MLHGWMDGSLDTLFSDSFFKDSKIVSSREVLFNLGAAFFLTTTSESGAALETLGAFLVLATLTTIVDGDGRKVEGNPPSRGRKNKHLSLPDEFQSARK